MKLVYFTILLLLEVCSAQISLPAEERTNGKETRLAFEGLQEILTRSTVAFYDKNHNKGRVHSFLGTVASEQGLVLTKASELSDEGDYFVRIAGKKYIQVKEIARLDEWDVALFQVGLEKGERLTPPAYTETAELDQGLWVVQTATVTRRSGMRTKAGVLSGYQRKIKSAASSIGVIFDPKENELRVKEMHEKGSAIHSGLKVGDIIFQVNETKVSGATDFFEALQECELGTEVTLLVMRGGEEVELTMEVLPRTQVFGHQPSRNTQMSGRLSFRRENFPKVFQYDINSSPRTVGGPVFLLNGKCIGMTIARADRVTTLGIPSEEIPSIINKLLAQAKIEQ